MKLSDASPTEVVDRDHLSAFLDLVFGRETTGAQILFFAEIEGSEIREYSARAIGHICDRIEGLAKTGCNQWTSLVTESDEITGVALSEIASCDQFAHAPSLILKKEDRKVAIWLLDHPVILHSEEAAEIRKIAEVIAQEDLGLPAEDMDLIEAFDIPIPGYDGWRFADPKGMRLKRGPVKRYTPEQLAEIFLPNLVPATAPDAEEAIEEALSDRRDINFSSDDAWAQVAITLPKPSRIYSSSRPLDEIPEEAVNLVSEFVPDELVNREIKIALGPSAKAGAGKWENVTLRFGKFVQQILCHREGEKDGFCFLQGSSAKKARIAKAMVANYLVGLDLDTGQTLDEIRKKINEHGLLCIYYSTHSHMKRETEIVRDHYIDYGEETGSHDIGPGAVRQYLTEKKGFLSQLLKKVEIVDERRPSDSGRVIVVRHAIPKYRLIFLLEEPFEFGAGNRRQTEDIREWSERYAAFATALGVQFDEKCRDPSRLFYLPRYPFGREGHCEAGIILGEPLRLEDYDLPRGCLTSAPTEQIEGFAERRISGSSQ